MTKPQTESGTRQLIGRRLWALRLDADMTIQQVAQSIDIPDWKLRDLEGGNTLPNIVIAGMLCSFYEAPLEFLLTGRGLTRELQASELNTIILKAIQEPVSLTSTIESHQHIETSTKAGILDVSKLVPPVSNFKLRLIGDYGLQIVQTTPVSDTILVNKTIDIKDIRGAGRLKFKVSNRKRPQTVPEFQFDFSELQSFIVNDPVAKKTTRGVRKVTKPKIKPKTPKVRTT